MITFAMPDPLAVPIHVPHPVVGDGVAGAFLVNELKSLMVVLGEPDLREGHDDHFVCHTVVVSDLEAGVAEISVPADSID